MTLKNTSNYPIIAVEQGEFVDYFGTPADLARFIWSYDTQRIGFDANDNGIGGILWYDRHSTGRARSTCIEATDIDSALLEWFNQVEWDRIASPINDNTQLENEASLKGVLENYAADETAGKLLRETQAHLDELLKWKAHYAPIHTNG